MSKAPRHFSGRILDILAQLLNALLITAMAVLVAAVSWGVIARFLINQPSVWAEPLATWLLMWVSMLGAAVVYRENGHLGVDYFVGLLDASAQRIGRLVVELVVMFFSGYILCYGGYLLVAETLKSPQTVPGLGLEMAYVYLAIPLSGIFFVLFGLEHLVEWFRNPDLQAQARSEIKDV